MHEERDPDAAWVSALAGRSLSSARAAIARAKAERRLYGHLAREHARYGRRSYVEIDAPLELHALTRLLRPRTVLEVGVSSGVSSAYLLRALERNGAGTLHSVDLPSRPARRRPGQAPTSVSWSLPDGASPGWAVPFALRKRWDLRLGDKREVVPILAEELRSVDLVVYDVPHAERDTGREFRQLDPLLPPGGVVIADHGPSGGACPSLVRWARARSADAVRRTGLGLFGFSAGPR